MRSHRRGLRLSLEQQVWRIARVSEFDVLLPRGRADVSTIPLGEITRPECSAGRAWRLHHGVPGSALFHVLFDDLWQKILAFHDCA